MEADSGREYRKDVGPEELYDVVAAHQFMMMIRQGLRDTHSVLDFGCGSLRLGRLLIPFLLPGHYYGIEADPDLMRVGIANETGKEILKLKDVSLHVDDSFDCTVLNGAYDYILFHSIFSHASKDQIKKALASARRVIKKGGIVLATFYSRKKDYRGDVWVYPECVGYREGTMRRLAEDAGFDMTILAPQHPTRQTWMKLTVR